MNALLRFTTVRHGVLVVTTGEQAIEFDVRILRASDGSYRVLSGELSGPLPSLEIAEARACSPEPRPPDASCVVQWRDGCAALAPGEHPCPTCGAPAPSSPRYPRRLCPACVLEATDAHGRLLRFTNRDVSGGLEVRHADDGTLHEGHECLVRGIQCRAEEYRFGGVVVQPVSA